MAEQEEQVQFSDIATVRCQRADHPQLAGRVFCMGSIHLEQQPHYYSDHFLPDLVQVDCMQQSESDICLVSVAGQACLNQYKLHDRFSAECLAEFFELLFGYLSVRDAVVRADDQPRRVHLDFLFH